MPPYAYNMERLELSGISGESLERRKRAAAAAILGALPLPLSASEPGGLATYATLLFPHDVPEGANLAPVGPLQPDATG